MILQNGFDNCIWADVGDACSSRCLGFFFARMVAFLLELDVVVVVVVVVLVVVVVVVVGALEVYDEKLLSYGVWKNAKQQQRNSSVKKQVSKETGQ